MFELALLGSLLASPAPETTAPHAFPAGFVWGTATAAVQVEGHTVHSDWHEFCARPGAIKDGARIGAAARHFERFEEDFAQAEAMNTNGYRFSLEWSRLEPERGRWDAAAAASYRRMLDSLKAKGIRPLVTLHHFSNPRWVAAQGGWTSARTEADFEAFVRRCAVAFGDRVDTWLTFNEPSVYAMEGYVTGRFPPGRSADWAGAGAAMGAMIRAHARAYRVLHAEDTRSIAPGEPPCRVGAAEHLVAFHPSAGWNPVEHALAGLFEHVGQHLFLDAASSGTMRLGPVGEHVAGLEGSLDFVGVNYYTSWRVNWLSPHVRQPAQGASVTDLGLEVYPEGLYEVLKKVHARYGLPIEITELGFADRDRAQTPGYMAAHLARVSKAIAEGVPVRSVYWWSLLDNFEWQNGYDGGRFGLLEVDFDDPALPRRWTPAARAYARIAGANALPADMALTRPRP